MIRRCSPPTASLADLLDYNYIRSKVLTGDIVEHTYKKTDDTTFRVKVTPYPGVALISMKRSGSSRMKGIPYPSPDKISD